MAPVCGIDAATIRALARTLAGGHLEALAKLGLLKANGKKGRSAGYQLP